MTVFLDWRFLKLQKEAKTLQVYRFVSCYQTVASYRAAPRYDFHSLWGHGRRRMSFCAQIIDLLQNSYFGRHVR